MRRSPVLIAAAALALFVPGVASAQPQLVGGKLAVTLTGGAQPGSQNVNQSTTFPLYDEQAQVETSMEIKGGAYFDVGASYRVWNKLALGVSYSRLKSTGTGTIAGQLPHPLVFDQPRTFETSLGDLAHEEQAVHVQAIWLIPFTDKVDFSFYAGPSFFNVTQDMAQAVTFSEVPPAFTTVTIDSVDVVTLKKNGTGFNIGGDGSYKLTNALHAVVTLRYTRAPVDFEPIPGQTTRVNAGNAQFGAGVRVTF